MLVTIPDVMCSEGQVRVTRKVEGRSEEEELRFLSRGDYFGEQALLKTDIRTANIIANTKVTECLALDRESFFQVWPHKLKSSSVSDTYRFWNFEKFLHFYLRCQKVCLQGKPTKAHGIRPNWLSELRNTLRLDLGTLQNRDLWMFG